ncbi:LPXTG cell wall anchor domain-containing protein [Isoptericola sp. NPDC056618]|uniref:LPXTG cell wall anchor domain-containing protein n=1 Tax=Isoptericola sp. NPDC056618 TaxID=3345878 RepID=UPI003690EAC3
MRHATVTATAAALLLISAGPAAAGGSDDEPPYQVTADGLTLPAGDAFRDGGHVNIRYTTPEAGEQGAGIHFETLNQRPSGAYVGKQFLPWSALLGEVPAELCITWVQVEGYNEHFGEGGQEPVCAPTTGAVPEPSGSPEASAPPVETPTTPDAEEPALETSSPTTPSGEDTTDAPAPGTESVTPDAETGGGTRPSPADEPAASRSEAPVSDDVVGGGPRSVAADASERSAAPAADGDATVATVEELPRTGAAVAGLVVAAAALLGAGAALLLVRRRRRA